MFTVTSQSKDYNSVNKNYSHPNKWKIQNKKQVQEQEYETTNRSNRATKQQGPPSTTTVTAQVLSSPEEALWKEASSEPSSSPAI